MGNAQRPDRIRVTSADPLFNEFLIQWLLEDLPEHSCRVNFSLHCEAASFILRPIFEVVLGEAGRGIVTADVVSDYANIGYDFIPYRGINDVGRQWIRKYTLALSKELLGAVREKYSSVPIPGSEISLDGAALRAEAQTEKEALITQLRENLEELSRKVQFENRNKHMILSMVFKLEIGRK